MNPADAAPKLFLLGQPQALSSLHAGPCARDFALLTNSQTDADCFVESGSESESESASESESESELDSYSEGEQDGECCPGPKPDPGKEALEQLAADHCNH